MAHLATTHGLPAERSFRYGALSLWACFSRTPLCTSRPVARSSASPPPATWGNGSAMAATTRATPAASKARVQGGVLPWWQQGSNVTYMVVPRARDPAIRNASTSACAWPKRRCQPSPTISAPRGDDAADHRVRLDKALPLGRQFQAPVACATYRERLGPCNGFTPPASRACRRNRRIHCRGSKALKARRPAAAASAPRPGMATGVPSGFNSPTLISICVKV